MHHRVAPFQAASPTSAQVSGCSSARGRSRNSRVSEKKHAAVYAPTLTKSQKRSAMGHGKKASGTARTAQYGGYKKGCDGGRDRNEGRIAAHSALQRTTSYGE
jgi:hypothetical protein